MTGARMDTHVPLGSTPTSEREKLLVSFLDAMPAEAFIKDLTGKLLYSNIKHGNTVSIHGSDDVKSDVRSDTSSEDHTVLGMKHRVTSLEGEKVIHFPLEDSAGKTFAFGGLIIESLPSSPADNKGQKNHFSEPPQKKHKGEEAEEVVVDSDHQQRPLMMKPFTTQPDHCYQRMFTNMPMAAAVNEVITDSDNNPIDWIFREVNPAFEEFTGVKGEEIIGKRASECLPGLKDDPNMWIQNFGKVGLTGGIFKYDEQYDTSLKKWFSGIAYQSSRRKGVFVSLFSDVTYRVQREEDFKESEERHRNLFESMVQGVVYQNTDGNIIDVNPSAIRILGLSRDQLMGRTTYDPMWKAIREDGSDFPGDEHPVTIARTTGKKVAGVVMGIYHPVSDSHHWIVVDAIPRFHKGDDRLFQVYATFTDMTETKEFERKLLREKARAEMADRLKSAFLANMSHEIRTPLNGIIGNIDLALTNQLSAKFRSENLEGLRVARQSGDLLITIIQDVLDLSKIEAAQLDIDFDNYFAITDLVDQVKSIGDTIISQKSKQITLEVRVPTNIHPFLRGDVFRLQQVLNNLVSNAIKFTDEGKVTFEIKISGEFLEFSVCDTGKGIPANHQETIFEPFRQVEFGDTRKHGGTGLGLTISRKLVEMMGGKITLKSSTEKPTNGSCFTFTFPYRQYTRTAEEIEADNATIKSIPLRKTVVRGKILVAEDESVSRRLVQRMLEMSGYDVLLAENGHQAVNIFKSRDDIVLILMDVQMPVLDGLSATKQIRDIEKANSKAKPVPVIALSANAMKGDNERGLDAGMTSYLTKPVNMKLLKETLIEQLGELPHPP